MRILLTNDDGAAAPGLHAFATALERAYGEVTVIVPDIHRSGCGHSMSLSDGLRVVRSRDREYHTTGFPSDCVKFGLFKVFDVMPDLVVSGINRGENTGVSVFYSGTMGGAREGSLNGITSIAVSAQYCCDPGSDKIVAAGIESIRYVLEMDPPSASLWNVNIPDKAHGTVIARQGRGRFLETLVDARDSEGRDCYVYEGSQDAVGEMDTDTVLFRKGLVTVTPISCDTTDDLLYRRFSE